MTPTVHPWRAQWAGVPQPPCHECQERSPTCHADCAPYLAWRKELAQLQQQKKGDATE